MAGELDKSEFVDRDYLSSQHASVPPRSTETPAAIPKRTEELNSRVHQTQAKIQELREAQERLERERNALEEARRQRSELSQGLVEMLDRLPKGIQILHDASFKARRDSEQMAVSLSGLKEALEKVKTIRQDDWPEETYREELSNAMGIVENARMEWNTCLLKWTILDSTHQTGNPSTLVSKGASIEWDSLARMDFKVLCRIGLGLTWPVALALLVLGGTALALWMRQ